MLANGDYSVDNGLENFVLIMMRKDHDEIESGLGLEPARIKKLSKIQQGCVVYTWKKFRKTDVILDGKLIASAQNNFRKLSRERAFDNLLRSQYRIVLIKEHYVSGVEEFVFAHSLNLDATKIGQRPDTRVHVKQMKCSTKLMDLFWIMYQVLEEEDDYLIFQGASLIYPNNF
ncbi:hypothetical protein DAPPUDRAFT_326214 [Daphnia pulex]|uniref:Uncharacterized protein n=1 Tax=Daphnia pulex TaxID=6669 RepID=E9H6W1_DAPPU|nr:hypothetical protein DAPPUDRAFT_326214 [Daphnia pulex]|eukprot:EFX72470.1 hypothetical protein DAPPUDRAFT_326214 [Daphnia pulex]